MTNLECIKRSVIAAAASLEAFESTYMRLIEDAEYKPDACERERAMELFYVAYDKISDAQFYLHNSNKE